ncbi:hypothetical protein [Streptomyces sp. NPDC019937]
MASQAGGVLREADEAPHWAEALRALVSYDDLRAAALCERITAALA